MATKIDLLGLEETDVVGSLSSLKLMCYSTNNQGKSFQATKFPKPLLLMAESGASALKCKKIAVQTWSDMLQITKQLTADKTSEQMHELYETIIVDTAEALIGICESAVCNEYSCSDLGEVQQAEKGNPNGYTLARKRFSDVINLLTSSGYCVLFLAHEEQVTMTDEVTGEEYVFIQPKGSENIKSSMRFLRDLCDVTYYLKPNGIDMETYEEIPSSAIFRRTKNVFARSRFDAMPFMQKRYEANGFIELLQEAIAKRAEDEGSVVSSYQKDKDLTKEEWLGMLKPYVTELYKGYPDKVNQIVASVMGQGRKISDCSEEEVSKLEVIHTKLVELSIQKGVEV